MLLITILLSALSKFLIPARNIMQFSGDRYSSRPMTDAISYFLGKGAIVLASPWINSMTSESWWCHAICLPYSIAWASISTQVANTGCKLRTVAKAVIISWAGPEPRLMTL